MSHLSIFRRFLKPSLDRSSVIDPTKIDEVIEFASRNFPLRTLPGHVNGGLGLSPDDVRKIVGQAEDRPGWRKATAQADTEPVSINRGDWSVEEFLRLPPMERLKLANAGAVVHDKEDGRVHRVLNPPKP